MDWLFPGPTIQKNVSPVSINKMLEGLVAWVLNNYLGKYVENLNTDQLSIALLQGEVELENLPLKKNALRYLGLPIEVRSGLIGKVKLQIPVRQIRSAPWVIIIEQLHLVAGPVNLDLWEESVEEAAELEHKLGLLDALEARWRAETEAGTEPGYYASSYSSWLSYGTSLVTNIVENLQLRIKDVHLRYEDDMTVEGRCFAAGITVAALSAQSCDDRWTPGMQATPASAGVSYKLLEMSSLGIYWDTCGIEELLSSLPHLQLTLALSSAWTQSHQWILNPTSAQAQVKRNRSDDPLRSKTTPRLVCDLQLEDVVLSITDIQYEEMFDCFRGLNDLDRRRTWRRYRPCTLKEFLNNTHKTDLEESETISKEDKLTQSKKIIIEWWRYAIRCHLPNTRCACGDPPWNWEAGLKYAKENVLYVEICQRLLTHPTSPLTAESKMLKDQIELNRPYEQLRALREAAMRRARPARRPSIPSASSRPHASNSVVRDNVAGGRSLLVRWFPQWWGWYESPQSQPTAPATSPDAEAEILEALAADADSIENDHTVLRRDTVFGQFHFKLKRGSIRLAAASPIVNSSIQTKLELAFEHLLLGYESRPRSSSHRLRLKLGSVTLNDRITPDTLFPVLITPPGLSQKTSSQLFSYRRLITKLPSPEQPLFELVYESGSDKKLHVCSQALEVVYNPEATKWFLEFVSRPHRTAARRRLEQIRQRTKDEFLRNWDQVLKGNNVNLSGTSRTWHIELDVSAPHIVLVENLTDRNSAITVVDFGKLHFSNRPPTPPPLPPQINIQSTSPTSQIINMGIDSDPEDDDDDLFATPCSTPPGSEVSSSEEVEEELLKQPSPLQTNQRLTSQPISDVPKSLNDRTLHDRLYERYNIELSEIQVLVGRVRDNWQYAHLKGTSALHLLDRVNISIQAERRLVYTHDPRYPAVTINARVPRLVVHLNENKVDALRILARQLAATSPSSPFRQPECQTPTNTETDFIKAKSTSTSSTGETYNSIPGSEDVSQASEAATAALGCVAQFTVETLALEIQSRGRAVAELQVSGVRAGLQQRPLCQQISLSVHSLLLVDALQAFGPDFELLIASHRHVGMDSLSGSIRGSEPTSPISPTSPRSPASPEPPVHAPGTNSSSLHHLAQALASLKRPPNITPITQKQSTSVPNVVLATSPVTGVSSDAEALITVEITLLQANPKAENTGETIRIAAVQFNNLDVTANQETIVELLGFARRIFPETVSKHTTTHSREKQDVVDNQEMFPTVSERTELTFDFHRLSVLLLRGVVRDHTVIGKKIATATMAEAKFHASFGSNGVVQVKGSLGGLQVVDLTPEGSHHQRIISVGKDPFDIMTCLHSGLYGASYDISLGGFDVSDALTIQVDRNTEELIVILRVASVWYTHSRHLLQELHSCAAEFESYLREVARSLSARAAEMALGLSTPRRHRRKSSVSSNSYSGFLARSNERLDSPDEEPISSLGATESAAIPGPDINIKLEVELDSPVLVFPRHATSNEVLVAHLGTIHAGNRRIDTSRASGDDMFWDQNQQRQHSYYLEVRDMNVYSLDISERITNSKGPLPRAERIYACRDHGRPILHDTMVSIQVEHFESISTNNDSSILLEDFLTSETPRGESFNITGGVVTPLRLALSRAQYEQVLDTLKAVLNPEPISQPSNDTGPATMHAVVRALSDIAEETPGVATLRMDPAVRARLHQTSQHQASATPVPPPPPPAITTLFTIPELTLELRTDVDQKALVELCLQDFAARWERPLGGTERHLQVSLRSICFEDLLQPADSPHRRIVQSSGQGNGGSNPWIPSLALSRSCPDMLGHLPVQSVHGSLPDHLEAGTIFGAGWGARGPRGFRGGYSQNCVSSRGAPATPPPSPRPSPDTSLHARADNLVHVDAVLNDTHREIAVRFNALDVIFNIESWVVVLDFFGLGGGTNEDTVDGNLSENETNKSSLSSESNKIDQPSTISTLTTTMDIEVRAFSVQLNHPASSEIARLTASHFTACFSTFGSLTTRLHARLGRLVMQDLTKHGTIYRDRFMTAVGARETFSFDWESTSVEASLTLSMASVVYVHTQRFLSQVLGFFRHFSQLQEKLRVLRSPPSENSKTISPKKIRLNLNAGSPLILIPLSSHSSEMLVADLGELTASNHFKQVHSKNNLLPSPWIEITDVQLVRMDLYAARREFRNEDQILSPGLISFKMPSYLVVKRGPSLLKDKCELNLEVQRNIEAVRIPEIADMCVRGRLSTLKFDLDLDQYRLLRGLLAKNIGENLDDIGITVYVPPPPSPISHNNNPPTKWTTNSLQLELHNISILIRDSHESTDPPIARVDLIRSKLLVETFSDRTQDVDLLSQEILLSDTRFLDAPMNKRGNIFSSILKPARTSSSDHVQVEIHHRRRHDFSKFTVMLNNMRLIAVVDWWQTMNEFVLGSDSTSDLFQTFESSAPSAPSLLQTQQLVRPSPLAASAVGIVTKCAPVVAASADGEAPWEFKLNVTDCELVLVEDTSRPDSVAIILKSTTVLSWRPRLLDRPLSCNLNRCEIVSCVLGHEEETALSVVDPVTVNLDVARRQPSTGSAAGDAASHRGLLDAVSAPPGPLVLEVQLHQLAVRLSYQDMRVFTRMLESLPKQTRSSSSRLNQPNQESSQPANVRGLVDKLRALGFSTDDCIKAIRVCHGHLDEAALWLTHNADSELLPIPTTPSTTISRQETGVGVIDTLELKAHCISICIIDDCLDCDVPLLEVSLAQLSLHQDLLENEDQSLGIMTSESGNGFIKGVFSAEYYNRSLSGWEPWIEPWRGELGWLRTPTVQTTVASPSRFVFNLTSDETLDMTITSTLVELISLVKDTWTADVQATPRRRQPFIPYALQNSTGSSLCFGTCTSDVNDTTVPDASSVAWISVSPGETKPFTFDNARRRIQHRRGASHGPRALAHQLTVRIEGWRPITPVTIDQVGIYFRDASADPSASINNNSKFCGILSSARIVLQVTLEGTARKLITIRSSLQISNQLLTPMEIRLENPSLSDPSLMVIEAGTTRPVPLAYATSTGRAWTRPVTPTGRPPYAWCSKPFDWSNPGTRNRPGQAVCELRECFTNDHVYRVCIVMCRDNFPPDKTQVEPGKLGYLWSHPCHTLTLIAPITLNNLLPFEIYYTVAGRSGRLAPNHPLSLHHIDPVAGAELAIQLENYPTSGSISIPPTGNISTSSGSGGGLTPTLIRVRLFDSKQRRLHLAARIKPFRGGPALQISLSAPFWLINKTALPLVFRQEGVPGEGAGQFDEHEVARMVAPLLFSFSDPEASPTVSARVGSGLHSDLIPQWSHPFTLQPGGVQVRRLRVAQRENRPDIVYLMAVEARLGRGKHRPTTIVTLSPRYQLRNRSSLVVQFAQLCLATTVTDPGAQATHLQASPGCNLPFHWPRLDKDQLLCVRLPHVPGCLWSGGFRIDIPAAFHLSIRDSTGRMIMLRCEITSNGPTLCATLSDADGMPPPLRIDNFSEVPIKFYQTCVTSDHLATLVRAHCSIPFAWDEPIQPPSVTLVAPGGVSCSYDTNKHHEAAQGLNYENFIYIILTGTFQQNVSENSTTTSPTTPAGETNPWDMMSSQQLVLSATGGSGSRVTLACKQPGARDQLWRLTPEGHLQHEGSSPPSLYPASSDKVLVLDIVGPAPQPTQYVALSLRRPDPRRKTTQTWQFTPDGRLSCAHHNMCVQAMDGFLGLRPGSEAVLGPQRESAGGEGPPLEQAVSKQKLRPGSGFLSVSITTDGPTTVVYVVDTKASASGRSGRNRRRLENIHWSSQSPNGSPRVDIDLTAIIPRFGLSLVQRSPAEELLYVTFNNVNLHYETTNSRTRLQIDVRDLQVDNQLWDAQSPVVLYSNTGRLNINNSSANQEDTSALMVDIEKTTMVNVDADMFRHFIVRTKNLILNIEERLLLKLFLFAGYDRKDTGGEGGAELDGEITSAQAVMVSQPQRYYLERIQIVPSQVRLSVITSNKQLPPVLASIKRRLGLTLIRFEDACIELEPFVRTRVFEPRDELVQAALKHYKAELKWQAAVILGSVDFLGNPIGFVNDVSEGVSGLIYEGSVGALVKNVTHGISNSAAKVTESLSDGLGRVTMDERHEETRRKILRNSSNTGTMVLGGVGGVLATRGPATSGEHLIAGLKGLGLGLLGGVTSVFKQSYEGAANEGLQGFVAGFGKGLVGTVTKPVVGVLDLASETASAVRESSRSSNRTPPERIRPPRVPASPGGLLLPFSRKDAQGQQFLHSFTDRETFSCYEILRSGPDDLRILVSSDNVRVFSCIATVSVIIQVALANIYQCVSISVPGENQESLHYIELTMTSEDGTAKRPRVRCDMEATAQTVTARINHARRGLEQRRQTVLPLVDPLEESLP